MSKNAHFSLIRTSSLALALVAAVACGSPESRKSLRTSNGGSEDLTPRKVGSSDAVPQDHMHQQAMNGDDQKGDGSTGDGKGSGDEGGKDPVTDPVKDPVDKDPVDDTADTGTPVIQKIQTSVGLRNFDQINATMSTLTGIPRTTTNVATVYRNQLSTSLPTDNDIKAFLGSQQVAVFKLAVEYCDALVRDTTRRAAVFGTFNFAGTPAVVLDATGKEQLADALVSQFWGKDLTTLPAHADSVTMVVGLIDDILIGKNPNSAAVTPAVVTGACTAVLASAPVVMF